PASRMTAATPSSTPAMPPITGAAAAGTSPASVVAPAAMASTEPATRPRGLSSAQSRADAVPPAQASTASVIVTDGAAPQASARPARPGAKTPPQNRPPPADRRAMQPNAPSRTAMPKPSHQLGLGAAPCARRDMNSHTTRAPPTAGRTARRQADAGEAELDSFIP